MMRDSQAGERTLVKFVLNDSDAGTRQSRIRRPTLSLLPPLALRTTTISPLAGEMPVSARMFAPCVTTRRIPLPVHLSMTARAGGQGLSLIAQHDHIAECRLGLHRSQLQQRCRVHAAAPWRAEDS